MFSASMKPATRCVTLPASPQWGRKVKVGNDRSLQKKKKSLVLMRQSMYKPAGKACNINSTITVSEFMDHPVHVISYQTEGSEEESYQYIRNFI